MPLLRCSPSVFCDTSVCRKPAFCMATNAMCVRVGSACDTDLVLARRGRAFLAARSSQAPGPVSSTVFMPERKSGMPAEVLIPAAQRVRRCGMAVARRGPPTHRR